MVYRKSVSRGCCWVKSRWRCRVSLGFALGFAALFHQFRREMPAAQEYAESAVSLATEQGFPHWMAGGAMLRGWALAYQGQAKEGIEQLHQGLMGRRAMASYSVPVSFSKCGETIQISVLLLALSNFNNSSAL